MTLFTYSFCGIKTFFLRNCLQSYRTFTCFASAVNISEYDSTQVRLGLCFTRFFFKENGRYLVWTCRDPISQILGT